MNFISTLINGLSLGGIYALIALGYTMVYGIAKMLNFAHGDIIMVGGYTLIVFLNITHHPLIAVFAAIIFCLILGIVIEKVAYKPLRGASPLAVLITAIGVSYLLQSLAQIIFSPNPKVINIFPSLTESIKLFGVSIKKYDLVSLVSTLLIMIALTIYIKYTKMGRAMIATSEDRDATQLMGINVNKVITVTFAIGSTLAAVAALFFFIKNTRVENTSGAIPGIKAFTAAVIGGIGSIPGAMLGGFLLGIVETLAQSVGLSSYVDAIEFLILIVILLVRPAGILGKKRREKV